MCLASGGGQQSALFSLLGASVTVFDLSENQLEMDLVAANHYGYKIKCVQGDMTNLTELPNDYFDYVFQPVSAYFIRDLKPLYESVYQKVKFAGNYVVGHSNPSTYPVWFDRPDNESDPAGYLIAEPKICGPVKVDGNGRENIISDIETGKFRHSFADIFNKSTDVRFRIVKVWEDPRHTGSKDETAAGSEEHKLSVIMQYFNIWSIK